MIVVGDIEANGLFNPDKLWCAVFREVHNPEKVHVFENLHEFNRSFQDFLSRCSFIIGHNWIGFDNCVLNSFGYSFPNECIIDTLVCSRLFNFGIEGGHSIEAWGNRLNCPKVGLDITDWSTYTPYILERCIQDTKVNLKLYNYFLQYINNPSFTKALRLEHDISFICLSLKKEGFPFNKEKAESIKADLTNRIKELDNELKEAFPPKVRAVREINPRITKSGTLNRSDFRWYGNDDLTPFYPNAPFTVVELEDFNPGSVKQIVERLNDAGWKPTEKTKGHSEATKHHKVRGRGSTPDIDPERLAKFQEFGWKISEENLRTLPDSAPEAARKLTERLLLAGRLSDLEEWLGLVAPSAFNSRPCWKIHGTFNGIGAWTHRMSTNSPNMQNIPVPQGKDNPSRLDIIGDELAALARSLFYAPDDVVLIGTDADGIQMRIFAHYVNDERLINALVSGDKKLGTDIHSLHWRALGPPCKGRNPAKTFIYAWLLGAGKAKVAEILECSLAESEDATINFTKFYPGLSDLKEHRIPSDARRGYFEGLDGRLVVCNNEHKMLGGYLQNGESIIMKRACRQWRSILQKEKIPFWQVNYVHDEWQTLSLPEHKDYIAKVQQQAIVDQGEQLKLNCPLAAQSKFGHNWMDTH